MRYITVVLLVLFICTEVFAAVELDSDSNSAIDVTKGGTNANTSAGARSNLGLGNVDNTSDANKPISTATQSALNGKANTSAFASQAAFTSAWGWTPGGGVSAWSDIQALLTGTGTYVRADGTTGDPTGTITTGTGVAAAMANALDGTGGLASKAALDALPSVVFGTGIAVAEDTPSAGTDTVSIDADTSPTDGSAKPITSNAVFDALAGKQNADADLTTASGATGAGNSKYFGTNSSGTAGFYDLPSGSGSFAFDTFPTYTDSVHSSGIAVNGTTLAIYSSTAGKWLTVGLTDSLTHSPVDTAPDAFTFTDVTNATLSTEYTALAQINGIASGITCSGSGGPVASCTGSTVGTCGTFGSTSGTITSGQYVGAKVTSSSVASTPVNNTVTCNGVSDTFTVTTSSGPVSYTDDFNRSDGALGANWTTFGTGSISIISNQVGNTVSSQSGSAIRVETIDSNQYVQAKCTVDAATSLLLRYNSSTDSGYSLNIDGDNLHVYRIDNGVSISLTANISSTVGPTDVIKFTAVGSTLTIYKNGSYVASITDSTYTSGKTGLSIWHTAGRFDDFETGNIL